MNIVFRVDASTQMGTGHVMRCLTLAKALKNNGVQVQFICRDHKGHLIEKIKSVGFNVFTLTSPSRYKSDEKLEHSNWLGQTQKKDAADSISILKDIRPHWIIIDHYGIDQDWQLAVRAYCQKIMVIDDLSDRIHNCDVLLDQTFECQERAYNLLVPKDCKLLLGSKYALLRPEFLKWRQFSIERRNSSGFKTILINMGGTDPNDATGKILDELASFNLKGNLKLIIIMSKESLYLESIRAKANKLSHSTEIKTNVANMAEIMAYSDLAIGASGSTSWERCCLGLPTIQVIIAANQKKIASNLEDKKIIRLLKSFDQLEQCIETMKEDLATYSKNAQKVIDGNGTKRVLNTLYE